MIKLIDQNFKEHASVLPSTCNIMQVLTEDGLTYIDSGLKVDTFNVIHIHDGEGLTAESLKTAVSFYENRLRESCIWISEEQLNENVKNIFETLSIKESGVNKGFWAKIENLQEGTNEAIKIVEERQDIIDNAFVVANNWEPFDVNVLHYYNHVHPEILKKTHTIMFNYYQEGQVVGVIELFISLADTKVAGIYNLSVMKENRKQGIGEALVKQAIAYAKNNGVETIVTQASEDSENIFRKVGFTEEGKILEYV
ncbi:GNAT family N-acetyltransferase [Flammeovirga aprica]|uniref:GNAT family N-acetyltransferase n=1 Tax=Flammeovirga aprica JL-4 TaxID=694437 RepID=A0A7X9RXC2_9BACT|nr:GNAT family N-acetyltransferase [Flammeovirga aprica]NME70432.1 GNAT family N-acetyltransferase [Flammeovirga aprica JL-4]